MSTTPELLSPAGDRDAMRAAVANGADAVYFGLGDFNARHRATNFTLEELPETIAFLHEHGVRGYVTFNTLIFSDELPRAAEYVAAIARAGADAVIVQDLGLARLIHRMCPDLPIHGSTQMTLTEPRGIEFVRGLGVERVIAARELSLPEIRRITQATRVPVEIFVHGALCVAYSGQCLTSEALGGRSANRGQCAQACRQPYELMVDGAKRDLGDKAYLLSPQDLSAWELVPDLAEAGVVSLKIEGRLKSAHYVAATTQTYRAAIDAAAARRPFDLTRQQELDLAQSFSRGFTHGFLSGVNHQQLVQGRFPKSRGVKVGVIVEITRDGVIVALDPQHLPLPEAGPLPIKPGDGVVIDEGHPEQDEQGGRVFAAAAEGDVVRVTFGRGDVNLSAIAVGSFVWRTDDPALRKRLERTWNSEPRQSRPLDFVVRAVEGERLRITATDAAGLSVVVTGDAPLAVAQKQPIRREVVCEQLGRLGGTPFMLRDVALEGQHGPAEILPVMVPKSVLNDLRRRAVEALQRSTRGQGRDRTVDSAALAGLRSEATALGKARLPPSRETRVASGSAGASSSRALSVLVRSDAQVQAVLDWQPPDEFSDVSLVYLDFEDVRRTRDAVRQCRRQGIPVAIATPRIIKPGEEGLLRQIAGCAPDAVLIRNLASLSWFQEHAPDLPLLGDYALNVTNELTAAVFVEAGMIRLTPGYDLNLQQLRELLSRADPGLFEVVLHQHLPMFHMEHCVFSHVLSNGKDFHDCGRPCDRHQVELRDHVGESHPLVADVGCRNTLFNAHAQSAAPYLAQLRQWGVTRFRVELLRESPAETHALLTTYARVLAGQASPPAAWNQLRVLNQLGVTRGTLEFA